MSVSCVTTTAISGTTDRHGLLSGYSAADRVAQDATEVASYMVFLGLIDDGYNEYVTKVKEAEAKGKKITMKRTYYIFASKTTAYAK